MKPKELSFLYEKLKGMPLREHDKFSLNLLKTIAKGLAPPAIQRKQKEDYSKIKVPLVSSLKRRGSADQGYCGGSDGGVKNRGRRGGLRKEDLELRIDTQNLNKINQDDSVRSDVASAGYLDKGPRMRSMSPSRGNKKQRKGSWDASAPLLPKKNVGFLDHS